MPQESEYLTLRDEGTGVEDRLELRPGEFPHLERLLASPDGAALRQELGRLLATFRKPRAPRQEVRMMANLVMPDGREEPVLVEELSRTGLKVAVDRTVPLNLEELVATRLPLHVGNAADGEVLNLDCEFVRTAAVDADWSHLAFRFRTATAKQEATLERLARHLDS
jgi:hypothetical protein